LGVADSWEILVVGDRASLVPGPGCSADVSVHADAEGAARVIARLRDSLGAGGGDRCLTVGPVYVYGGRNDYATGRRAHPFDFLEWPTLLECEASSAAPAEVREAVAIVLEALWRGGFKAVAACDFEDDLPACGGRERYPVPPSPTVPGVPAGSLWRALLPFGKRKG
jgi:hypothetical protein